ncbi:MULTISPECIES: hypothetical protein [Cysteiniphilum]|uniref:Type IVB pilus formation outer membrane protein, R64 PilN family n=1 Tax=Cysteiniphilum litorale TaxID=2056700 RepID=A0A8J2Z3G9_9GAMM|nr:MULTISPECIES: hypothetical protein [Cysteiniphilum]GGF92720.1 type IVB pilus formation outer membrane protein, R64 PilN family [Cysteiniphilum litorale]
MFNKKLWYNLCMMTVVSSGLFGCAQMQKTDDIAKHNIDKANKIADTINDYKPDLISYNDNIYVASQSFKRVDNKAKLPDIFNEKITFNTSQPMTIQDILKLIGSQTNIPMGLTSDAYGFLENASASDKKKTVNADSTSSAQPVIVMQDTSNNTSQSRDNNLLESKTSLYYTGNVKTLLSLLAKNYGLWWKYNEKSNSVDFYYYDTKFFLLDDLPGVLSRKTSIDSNSPEVQGVQNTKTAYDSTDDKAWNKVIDTIKSFVGKDGHVESSPETGYVTVVTTPPQMKLVSKYIETINKTIGRSIAVRVDIYDVQQTNAQNYGFNWNLMYKVTSGSLDWDTTPIPVATSDALNSTIQTAKISGGISHGPFAGSQLIVNALSKLGKTSKVTSTTVYTANNSVVPIQNQRSISYIKQVSVNTLGGSGSSSDNIEKSATPGTVNVGYNVAVTPKLVGNNSVMINLTVSIATLLNMENVKIDDKGSYMQLPDIRNKSFMIPKVLLTSGQTIVLTGFQNSEDTTGQNSVIPGTILAGGNNAANHDHTVTVVIVTPYIMGK